MKGYKAFRPGCVTIYYDSDDNSDSDSNDAVTNHIFCHVKKNNYSKHGQYKVGMTYEPDTKRSISTYKFWDCPIKCYTDLMYDYIICEVEAVGMIITSNCVTSTDRIKIIKILNGKYKINGITYRYVNGILHSSIYPALKFPKGTEKWFSYGFLHREDGPAIVTDDGIEQWYLDGKLIAGSGPDLHTHNKEELHARQTSRQKNCIVM